MHLTWSRENSWGKSERFLEKLMNNFTDSVYPSNHRRSTSKTARANAIVSRFFEGIWFHTQRKDWANSTSIWFPKEIVTAIMALSKRKNLLKNLNSQFDIKSTKAIVYSPDGDTDFFKFVTGVLQRDKLAPYLLIDCEDYVHWISVDLINENSFTLKKTRNRQKR